MLAALRRSIQMTMRFTATLNAFNRGIENMKPAQAVSLIEDWEAALTDIDVPGTKGIVRDLASLRRQLEQETPDAGRVEALLHRLGMATTKVAPRAERHEEKVAALGQALTEDGAEQGEEEEDKEAAANPKRRAKKAA